jgi:hypothetical protein
MKQPPTFTLIKSTGIPNVKYKRHPSVVHFILYFVIVTFGIDNTWKVGDGQNVERCSIVQTPTARPFSRQIS